MFVSCVHPMAGLNDAICMTCNMLMLVENIGQAGHADNAPHNAGDVATNQCPTTTHKKIWICHICHR